MVDNTIDEQFDVIFPNETVEIITELMKKYGLDKKEEEMEKKLDEAGTPRERKELFENLPTCQISKSAKEMALGMISSETLPTILQKRLDIPENKVHNLAKELEDKVVVLAEKIPLEEEESTVTTEELPEEPTPPSTPTPQQETAPFKQKDVYREQLE